MEIGSNFGRTLADITQPGSGRVESRELDQQDFLKIMIEQMRHQNPLEPQDNSQFFAQIAQPHTGLVSIGRGKGLFRLRFFQLIEQLQGCSPFSGQVNGFTTRN